jgi:hypothetical protein
MRKVVALGIVLGSLTSASVGHAQNRKFSFGLEGGGSAFTNGMGGKSYLRQDQASQYYSPQQLVSKFNLFWGGASIEMQQGKWAFGGGLQYIQSESSISKNYDQGYYYVLYKTPDNSIEYLRTRELAQSASYLAIPLEVKFFPFPMDNSFKIFFSASAQMGFLLNFKNSVSFSDPSMDQHAVDVYALMEKPGGVMTTLNLGGGMQWTRPSGFVCTLGVIVPSAYVSSRSQLVNPTAGAGIFVRVQMPLSKIE